MEDNCVFCSLAEEEIICENDLAVAFYDSFPVSKGHVLIVPRRHVNGFFEAAQDELVAINKLAFEAKMILDEKYKPDGYNIGYNVGSAAGQTVFHLHMHIIPRYRGDVADPRGGIRKVKAAKAHYPESGSS